MSQDAARGQGRRRVLRRAQGAPAASTQADHPLAAHPPAAAPPGANQGRPAWTFLTNHAHVLVCIADEPNIRGRDIAARVGITERAAQAIIRDLVAAGYVRRRREGRRNRYSVDWEAPMRHPMDQGHTVGQILTALGHVLQSSWHDSRHPGTTDPPPRG
jgi:DNA-binding transcriptional ArsR family regulator